MTTEGWPEDGLTSAADVPEIVRFRVGPAEDPDRYEVLGSVDSGDEAWHVLDHHADAGSALLTLSALRPADAGDDELRPVTPDPTAAVPGATTVEDPAAAAIRSDPAEQRRRWQERAAGLARVHHPRLAGLLHTFAGAAPHAPGQADATGPAWDFAVLEQAAGRSVADWLRDDPGAGMDERFTILAAAAGVLQDLHRGSETAPPLVHGDITPRTLRLGGFWPSEGVRLAAASLGGRPRPGAAAYTAPEVLAGELPSAAADVFGFGATALHVLTGQPPATGPDGGLDTALVRRQLGAAPQTAAHPALADLLLQSLSDDPRQRPDRLSGWINGMRTVVDVLPPVAGPPRAQAAVPVRAEQPRVRTLPKRPFAVAVGALLLATAGGAIAITAVQQGRLAEVPNPVAIVQPPPVRSTAETQLEEIPPPAEAPTQGGGSGSSSGGGRGGGGVSTQAPSSDVSDGAGVPTPLDTVGEVPPTLATPGETLTPGDPTAPPVATPAPTGPTVTTEPTLPPVTVPPVRPPVTTPPVTPPVTTPPETTPPTSTPPTTPVPTTPQATTTNGATATTTATIPADAPGALPTIVSDLVDAVLGD